MARSLFMLPQNLFIGPVNKSIFVFLCAFSNVVIAANKYADADCANDGDGTASSCAASGGATGAWNVLSSVSLSNGDVLYLDGTFYGQINTSAVATITSLDQNNPATIDGSVDITGSAGDWTNSSGSWQKTHGEGVQLATYWIDGFKHTLRGTSTNLSDTDGMSFSDATKSYLGTGSDSINPTTRWTTIRAGKLMYGIRITGTGTEVSYINCQRQNFDASNGYAATGCVLAQGINQTVHHITCRDTPACVTAGQLGRGLRTYALTGTALDGQRTSSVRSGYLVYTVAPNTNFGNRAESISTADSTYDGTADFADGQQRNVGTVFQATVIGSAASLPTGFTVEGVYGVDVWNAGFHVTQDSTGQGVVNLNGVIRGNWLIGTVPLANGDSDCYAFGGVTDTTNYATGVKFLYNYAENCYNSGIIVSNHMGINTYVVGNTIINGGIASAGAAGPIRVNNGTQAYFNTIVGSTCGDGIYSTQSDTFTPAQQNRAIGNIVKGIVPGACGQSKKGINVEDAGSLYAAYNLMYGNTSNYSSGFTQSAGEVLTDPLLDSNYCPGAGSPALNAAIHPGVCYGKAGGKCIGTPDIGSCQDSIVPYDYVLGPKKRLRR